MKSRRVRERSKAFGESPSAVRGETKPAVGVTCRIRAAMRPLATAIPPGWTKMRLSLFQSVSYHSRPCGGAVAQLGERCVRNAEVEGSIPFRSIYLRVFTRGLCMILWGVRKLSPPRVPVHFVTGRLRGLSGRQTGGPSYSRFCASSSEGHSRHRVPSSRSCRSRVPICHRDGQGETRHQR
jgi:hypothetical protein